MVLRHSITQVYYKAVHVCCAYDSTIRYDTIRQPHVTFLGSQSHWSWWRWHNKIRYGTIRYDATRYDTIRYATIRGIGGMMEPFLTFTIKIILSGVGTLQGSSRYTLSPILLQTHHQSCYSGRQPVTSISVLWWKQRPCFFRFLIATQTFPLSLTCVGCLFHTAPLIFVRPVVGNQLLLLAFWFFFVRHPRSCSGLGLRDRLTRWREVYQTNNNRHDVQ